MFEKGISLRLRRSWSDWIPLSQVHEVNGVKTLNGLFGVGKPVPLASGEPVLRLIMNLTGTNSTQEQLEGGCLSLPKITGWQSVAIDNNETVELFQSDMSSAFYLFRLPRTWLGHLSFNIIVDGAAIGRGAGVVYSLSCPVIPMGWLNSVGIGIMQEISENLMKFGGAICSNQVFKGRHIPLWMNDVLQMSEQEDTAWYHVYLDNFCAGERIMPDQASVKGVLCHELAERAWESAGVVSSQKKKTTAARRVVELGAEIRGDEKTLSVANDKLLKLVQANMWLVVQRVLDRKHVSILMGRWIFVLQFRRPAMAGLEMVWKLISGTEKITTKLKQAVRREVLQLVLLVPLLHCNLGAGIEGRMVATDASEKGCAVVSSEQLSAEGKGLITCKPLGKINRPEHP